MFFAGQARGQRDGYMESTWAVIATFSNLVAKMETGDAEGIRKMILVTNVTVSTDYRAAGKEEYGEDINLHFATNGFCKDIQSVRVIQPSVAQVRTITTFVCFQCDTNGEWKITKYLDKPIE